ncbi:lysophospholipid acyltransferase family protein [Virgisporangium aurantiacum]|uniref:1-acyl-sn-glycerol-3-phosphate acyltransferase n=1 Tax=Virgisporangium aurantiacum TaxID=175570 RepID=A0A8J3Z9E1_9ACTN|nr:lysophospholipid acyltransferase family protein [Virgisporangium aurantiacum]GIJ57660.1 1-acyl-sn-glycerol-3-phosphate acyltransferase [Virgisporangium aurantiacum]
MSALYTFGKLTVSPVLRMVWRPRVRGISNIPTDGGVILAANHLSVVDSIVVPMVCPRPVYYLAKAEYFQHRILGPLLTGLNNIPVNRTGGREALLAIDAAVPVLKAGNVLGIHPEGTRSPDGRLHRGRPGTVKLALDTGARIVPVGLIGTDRIQPIGARLPKLARCEVVFGEPMDLSPYEKEAANAKLMREVTAKLMHEIAKLTGQEYVARYARRPQ